MANPKYQRSDAVAKRVETLSGYGLNAEQIAIIEKISRRTLFRYYGKELEEGREKAIANVSQTAYQMAVGGKVPAMTMFYLKCRARWKEVHAIEHSGPEGKPIETKQEAVPLTDEQQVKIAEAILNAKRK